MSKNPLKTEDGNLHLPVEGIELLDSIMMYITDQAQQGAHPDDIIDVIHDATCFWLMNRDEAEGLLEQHKKGLH